jgi:hypothetical protein
LPDLDQTTGSALRNALNAAQQTGLRLDHFDPSVSQYLRAAQESSAHGYAVTFLAVAGIAVVGLVAVALLVRRPTDPGTTPSSASNPTVPVDD